MALCMALAIVALCATAFVTMKAGMREFMLFASMFAGALYVHPELILGGGETRYFVQNLVLNQPQQSCAWSVVMVMRLIFGTACVAMFHDDGVAWAWQESDFQLN